MSELSELKKKLQELFELVTALIRTKVGLLFPKTLRLSKRSKKLSWGQAPFFISIAFIGLAALNLVRTYYQGRSLEDPFAIFYAAFGKNIPVAGRQSDGSFLLFGFESPKELKVWKIISAAATASSEFRAEGYQSLNVSFKPGAGFSAITLEEMMKSRIRISDWSLYESFQFQVANPQTEKLRLKMQITDVWGRKYERDIDIEAGGTQIITFQIAKMAAETGIRQIDQISFSMTGIPQEQERTLFFDALKLIPPAGGPKTDFKPSEHLKSKSRPVNRKTYDFARLKSYWLAKDPASNAPVVRIPFVVKNETQVYCHLCPVEGSVPFPMGELENASNVQMFTESGDRIPFQSRVLGRWPDKSIKWLALHFDTSLEPMQGAGYFLHYGPGLQAVPMPGSLGIEENETNIRIHTGPAQFVLNKKSFYLFDQVFLDENANGIFELTEEIASQARLSLYFRGKEHRADLDKNTYKLEIEERGSLKTVVKASAWYQAEGGSRYCQAVVRYYFYYGKSFVKVFHTLIYTGFPENPYLDPIRKTLLPKNETIESFSVELPYQFRPDESPSLLIGKKDFQEISFPPSTNATLEQLVWGPGKVKSAMATEIPVENPAGWVDLSTSQKGITVAVRHFQENFPKAFRLDAAAGVLSVDLWPKNGGELNLATTEAAFGPESRARSSAYGLAKTHELFFYFHPGDFMKAGAGYYANAFEERLLLRNNPYWIDASGVLGRLYPVDARYGAQEKILENLFGWAERQPRMFHWYGMLDFGDTLSWFRDSDSENQYPGAGWHPVGRWGWYNCEAVGTYSGALLQFVRSGDWKYFRFGENQARHIMDVDTVHYNTVAHDMRLRKVLSDEYSRVGSMHRHNGNHWGGENEEASHTNVFGILLYYYLTGDERARDVALEIGDFFLSEPFTYHLRPDMAPNRAMANALWGDVLLYELTGDKRFKDSADKLIDIFLRGQQDDGSFLENYNPLLKTWGGKKHEIFMSGYLVSAFISYHELTQDEDVKNMLVKLVYYLATQEFSAPVILHGMAYAYWITRDPGFLQMMEKNLGEIQRRALASADPMYDGLIYQKPIYHRPMAFLSTVPYVFGALEDGFAEQGK